MQTTYQDAVKLVDGVCETSLDTACLSSNSSIQGHPDTNMAFPFPSFPPFIDADDLCLHW